MRGNLNVRSLLTIVDDSNNFINTGTSPGDLAAYYCKTNQVIIGDQIIQNRTQFADLILGRSDRKVCRFYKDCLLYTSPSPRDQRGSRMPSSA